MCACVCMYVCTCVCVCIMCVCMYVCLCMYVCMYVCVYVLHMYILCMYVYVYICVYVFMRTGLWSTYVTGSQHVSPVSHQHSSTLSTLSHSVAASHSRQPFPLPTRERRMLHPAEGRSDNEMTFRRFCLVVLKSECLPVCTRQCMCSSWGTSWARRNRWRR